MCVCVSCSAMSNSLQPHGLQPASLLCPWDSAGKNTGVGRHSLFQGISPTQGLNLGLLHCGQILYHLSHQGGLTLQHICWIPDLILQHICVYLVCVHDPFCMTAYLWEMKIVYFSSPPSFLTSSTSGHGTSVVSGYFHKIVKVVL